MNYSNGEKIKIGDVLRLWEGCEGVVVCLIEDGEFSNTFTKEDWAYLKDGILISTNTAGLIHFIEPEETFLLINSA